MSGDDYERKPAPEEILAELISSIVWACFWGFFWWLMLGHPGVKS